MSVAALIVAAGRGTRLGAEIPKQYIPLNGVPALRRTVERFAGISAITSIAVVIGPNDSGLFEGAMAGFLSMDEMRVVNGGDSRAHSVRNGLEALRALRPEKVLIHDAARPFVPASVVGDVIKALEISPGAAAALPVVDALWTASDGRAQSSVPRDALWRAQTPQGFHFAEILEAHKDHDGSGADDVAVAVEAGLDVQFVEGSEMSFKITTAADLDRAQAVARQADGSSNAG